MFLTAETVAPYLIGRGVLPAEDIINGNFTLVELGRRNRNYKIYQNDGPGLFVKQAPMKHQELIDSLAMEAQIQRLARDNPAFESLRPWLPVYRHYDSNRHVLVSEQIIGTRDLGEILRTDPTSGTSSMVPTDFKPRLAEQIGRVVGKVHAAAATMNMDAEVMRSFPRKMPWAFDFVKQVTNGQMSHGTASPLSHAVAAMPHIGAWAAQMEAGWQRHTLVHGDLKWDNILIREFTDKPDKDPELILIDWELADLSDPCWDVAHMIYGYMIWAFTSMSVPNSPKPTAATLPQAREAVRAFWTAYADTVGLTPGPQRSAFVAKSIQLVAFRCIQGGVELSQGSPQPTPPSMEVLRTGEKILANPKQAEIEFFGGPAA